MGWDCNHTLRRTNSILANSAAETLPRVAIATGDPAGIGPEISLKAALDPQVRAICRPLLVGDHGALKAHATACGLAPNLRCVARAADASWSDGALILLERKQF